jgi:hypothetical protein
MRVSERNKTLVAAAAFASLVAAQRSQSTTLAILPPNALSTQEAKDAFDIVEDHPVLDGPGGSLYAPNSVLLGERVLRVFEMAVDTQAGVLHVGTVTTVWVDEAAGLAPHLIQISYSDTDVEDLDDAEFLQSKANYDNNLLTTTGIAEEAVLDLATLVGILSNNPVQQFINSFIPGGDALSMLHLLH